MIKVLRFAIVAGSLPVLIGLSVNLGARLVSAPQVGESYIYWLLTSYRYSIFTALLLWASTGLLVVLWVVGRVKRQGIPAVKGRVLGVAIYLACLATGFAIPGLVSGNMHVNSVQVEGRVHYLSEWYGSASNDGFFALWQCDGVGIVCKAIRQFTLREYGRYRLPNTEVALSADAEDGTLSVEVDGSKIFSEKP